MYNGNQNHHGHDCGRHFVDGFAQDLIPAETRVLLERLLVERISLRGICRAVGVTLTWLLGFLVRHIAALSDHLHVQPVSWTQDIMLQRPEVEADAMASLVYKKANKPWIWIAMDAQTRQVMAFHVGDRRRRSAERLWAKMPHAYRQHATLYTYQYVVYKGVIPVAQYRAISQLARQTNHIERFRGNKRDGAMRCNRDRNLLKIWIFESALQQSISCGAGHAPEIQIVKNQ